LTAAAADVAIQNNKSRLLILCRLPEEEIEEKLSTYRAELLAKYQEQAAAGAAAASKDRCVLLHCWLGATLA